MSVYVYASLCDFVCIALLLPFVLGFYLSVFLCFLFVFVFFHIVFSACYHWWICFLVWLLSSFFLFFIIKFFLFLIIKKIFLIALFYFMFFFLSFFSLPFILSQCGWQGLGALTGCQACAFEVGEPSPEHWSTRDLPAPRNIKWRKLSQRSPSQR